MSKTFHIWCDESRQTKDRYMVLGGLAMTSGMVPIFKEALSKYRQEHRMFSEVKWGKVSRGKLNEYKRFVDIFFEFQQANRTHFHALIIDSHCVDHGRFGADNEVGFYKFYYQLLLHCFGKNYGGNDNKLLTFLDDRVSSYSLNKLKTILNHGIKKRFGVSSSPFRSIEPCQSKESDFVQIVDVLIGAIGYRKNGCHLVGGASPAKQEMCEYIRSKSGFSTLTENTPWGFNRFRIWNFKLRSK